MSLPSHSCHISKTDERHVDIWSESRSTSRYSIIFRITAWLPSFDPLTAELMPQSSDSWTPSRFRDISGCLLARVAFLLRHNDVRSSFNYVRLTSRCCLLFAFCTYYGLKSRIFCTDIRGHGYEDDQTRRHPLKKNRCPEYYEVAKFRRNTYVTLLRRAVCWPLITFIASVMAEVCLS